MKPYKRYPPPAPGDWAIWIGLAVMTAILAVLVVAKIFGGISS